MVLGFTSQPPHRRPLMKPALGSHYPAPDQELKLAIDSSLENGMPPLSTQEIEELREMIQ